GVIRRFFFFQAEDGIRDDLVTGVQTCALPIWCLVHEEEDALGSGVSEQAITERRRRKGLARSSRHLDEAPRVPGREAALNAADRFHLTFTQPIGYEPGQLHQPRTDAAVGLQRVQQCFRPVEMEQWP